MRFFSIRIGPFNPRIGADLDVDARVKQMPDQQSASFSQRNCYAGLTGISDFPCVFLQQHAAPGDVRSFTKERCMSLLLPARSSEHTARTGRSMRAVVAFADASLISIVLFRAAFAAGVVPRGGQYTQGQALSPVPATA
jgi:hypothetical protein